MSSAMSLLYSFPVPILILAVTDEERSPLPQFPLARLGVVHASEPFLASSLAALHSSRIEAQVADHCVRRKIGGTAAAGVVQGTQEEVEWRGRIRSTEGGEKVEKRGAPGVLLAKLMRVIIFKFGHFLRDLFFPHRSPENSSLARSLTHE